MSKFVTKRLLLMLPTLIGAVTLVFFMTKNIPGDPARIMLGERANPESLRELREDLGLDQSLLKQYGIYLRNLATFNLGKSIKSSNPVKKEIQSRLPATMELALFSIVLASVFGIVLGVIAAKNRNNWLDYSAMSIALVGVSMPVFWLGLVLIMVFSVNIGLFPTGGRIDARLFFVSKTGFLIFDTFWHLLTTGEYEYFVSALRHIVLPSIALATIPASMIARTTRSSMLEVLGQDYIRTARASGLHPLTITFRYALKNALLPIVTVIGLQLGTLMAGAVLTETIFAWPGIGRWIYHSIEARDYPAIQGGILIIALMFILINILVDVCYSIINPKVRLT